MNHGAIETKYKGYKFRSRLEARWAVCFDSIGIEWKYEPQGYEANGSMYLPDFFLPASETWVEVKGSDASLKADRERIVSVLDWGSPMPGVSDSWSNRTTGGLLLLGEIPNHFGVVLHPLIQHSKGLVRTWASFFLPAEPLLLTPQEYTWLSDLLGIPAPEFCFESTEDHWTVNALCLKSGRAFAPAMDGYKAAREARFEHGRSGN